MKKLPGVGDTCYGGTIGTLALKTARMHVEAYYDDRHLPLPDERIIREQAEAISGMKRSDGIHPGGMIVAPIGEELISFTPLQHPWNSNRITTHFDYHAITDNLLKLDILGLWQMDLIHELQELTGVNADTIPLEDKRILDMLCDPEIEEIKELPEFGSAFGRGLIKRSCPKSFDDLIKVCALAHGTGVWHENQDELITKRVISLKECMASRDDIFLALVEKGMPKEEAYHMMNSVRRGKGLTEEMRQEVKQIGMPEWFIGVCEKIKYMFPKAHSVSCTLVAWRVAYFKLYYPEVFDEALVACG